MSERLRAYAISLIVAGLVASPLFGAFAGDSFPISTYPMFASERPAEMSFPHAIVVDADGDKRPAPPSAVATDEVIQALSTLRQAIRDGDEATQSLCERIAERVADGDAVEIRIVTSTFHTIDYFDGAQEPLARTVHTSCEVPR